MKTCEGLFGLKLRCGFSTAAAVSRHDEMERRASDDDHQHHYGPVHRMTEQGEIQELVNHATPPPRRFSAR